MGNKFTSNNLDNFSAPISSKFQIHMMSCKEVPQVLQKFQMERWNNFNQKHNGWNILQKSSLDMFHSFSAVTSDAILVRLISTVHSLGQNGSSKEACALALEEDGRRPKVPWTLACRTAWKSIKKRLMKGRVLGTKFVFNSHWISFSVSSLALADTRTPPGEYYRWPVAIHRTLENVGPAKHDWSSSFHKRELS